MLLDHLDRLSADEALLIDLFRRTPQENRPAVLAYARFAKSHNVGPPPTNVLQFPLPPKF